MKRSIFITLALLATIAATVLASTNPQGTPEWLLQRAGSKVGIDRTGAIGLEPRTGKGVTVTGALNFGADAGATDAYAITLSPALTAYRTGQVIWFKANTANTTAASLNVNALGAKTIKKAAGGITTDLATNDIRAGQYVAVMYDGTNFQMLSLLGNAPDVAASILASSISDSDTTHAPDGNSVFDALALKLDAAALTASISNGDTTHTPNGDAVFDALALKQDLLTNPVVGVGASYKIARGVSSITGSGTVVTGLTTVVSVTATPQSDLDGTTLAGCNGTIGDQAGAPAAGSVILKCWKITAADNGALIAADAAKSVNWIAVGN